MEKFEYLTGEDLGHRPSVREKTKFEYSPLGMSLSKSFKKDNVKNIAKSENDFNYDSNHKFYKFCNRDDEFEERCHKFLSRIRWNNLINFLLNLKLLSLKTQKSNSKRSELWKMLTRFMKRITMLTKMVMTMMS